MNRKTFAVVLAGGLGKRVGYDTAKQLLKIGGKPVMHFAMDTFEDHPRIDGIVVVVNPLLRQEVKRLLPPSRYRKLLGIVDGGATRRESSGLGLRAIPESEGLVLIHDAVRPFVTPEIIDSVLDALQVHDAVDVAIRPTDTIIRVDDRGLIVEIPDRRHLRRGQTPQGFRLQIIREAHRRAEEDAGVRVTDDCSLVLRYGLSEVFVVPGDRTNIKITYPQDLFLADRLFQLRHHTVEDSTGLERLRGRILAVVGGTRGIGEAIVELARERGAEVYPCSRTTGVDVTDYGAVAAFLERIDREAGRIDHVLNCAAILNRGPLSDRSPQEVRREVEINYLGNLYVVMASVPYLRRSRGSIVLFTSSSYTRGRPLYTTYSSAKAAIVNLVQGLSEEFEKDGIRINAVNPERAATPMRFENFGEEPANTLLKPEEVAVAALQAALTDASGVVIDVRRNR